MNHLGYSVTICPLLEDAVLQLIDRPLPACLSLSMVEGGTGPTEGREDKEPATVDNKPRVNSGKGVRRDSRRTLPQLRLPLRNFNGRVV